MAVMVDVLGWLGAIVMVVAYGLGSLGRLAVTGAPYQLMNLGAAAALLVNTLWYGALPSVALNLFWGGIAAVALARLRRTRA